MAEAPRKASSAIVALSIIIKLRFYYYQVDQQQFHKIF
jgi:hypothetical protein